MTQYFLIDIDFTMAVGTYINKTLTIDPFFTMFLDYVEKYNSQFDTDIRIAFYTANDNMRVAEVCFELIAGDWGFDPKLIKAIYHRSLDCGNCPMITYDTGKGFTAMKCLDLAASILRCKVDQIIMLIDDNPDMVTWNYPDKRVICKPFDGEDGNDVFIRLINNHKATGIWKA